MVTVGSAEPELSNQGERELGRSIVFKQGGLDPNFFGMMSDDGNPSRFSSRESKGEAIQNLLLPKDFNTPIGSKQASKATIMNFEEMGDRTKAISNMQKFKTVKSTKKGRLFSEFNVTN